MACARDGPQVRSLSTPGWGVSGVACSQPRTVCAVRREWSLSTVSIHAGVAGRGRRGLTPRWCAQESAPARRAPGRSRGHPQRSSLPRLPFVFYRRATALGKT
eukprot:2478076-Pyramimonas_sp.AAC.1